MLAFLQLRTRRSQITALSDVLQEMLALEAIINDYLSTRPPPGASAKAKQLLASITENSGGLRKLLAMLHTGTSTSAMRPMVLRQLEAVVLLYIAFQILLDDGQREANAIAVEAIRLKDTMSALDI